MNPSDNAAIDPRPGAAPAREYPRVAWTVGDSWIGVGLALVVMLAGGIAIGFLPATPLRDNSMLSLFELLGLLPILAILARRHAPLRSLGFRPFTADAFAIGCAAFLLAYVLTIIHNTVLIQLGLPTQAESIARLFENLESVWGLAVAGVIVAPVVEEIILRGFLFQGLRPAFGPAKAAIISSALFAVMHLQLEFLIPAFLLGLALAFVFHRSNSIWPGVLLHLTVNLLGVLVVWLMTWAPALVP